MAVAPQVKKAQRGAVRLPSYFKDEVETYKQVKQDYDTCNRELCSIKEQIEKMHTQLQDLSVKSKCPDYMCPELQEHKARAHERLQRVNARLDSEYGEQIAAVRSRILELESSLANIGSSRVVEPEPKVQGPTTGTGIEAVAPPQPVKNRRELKLAQMHANILPPAN